MKEKIIPILTNSRISPYKLSSYDNIQLKAQVLKDNKIKPIYLSNLPIDLYLNYSGSWFLAEQGVTNRFGYLNIYHSCINISGITNCLSKFTTIINGNIYESNISRLNFIKYNIEFGKDQYIMPEDYIIFNNNFIVF